jgi:hypothetical protein
MICPRRPLGIEASVDRAEAAHLPRSRNSSARSVRLYPPGAVR